MTVGPTVTAEAAIPTRTPAATVGQVGADPAMFLQLLVAEIQNQDPTKPMDSTQLVQQLAALSQVQQSAQTNAKLASMLEALSIGQAAALVGRSLTSPEGVDLGTVESVKYTGEGLVARLAGGPETVLGQGITIRA